MSDLNFLSPSLVNYMPKPVKDNLSSRLLDELIGPFAYNLTALGNMKKVLMIQLPPPCHALHKDHAPTKSKSVISISLTKPLRVHNFQYHKIITNWYKSQHMCMPGEVKRLYKMNGIPPPLDPDGPDARRTPIQSPPLLGSESSMLA